MNTCISKVTALLEFYRSHNVVQNFYQLGLFCTYTVDICCMQYCPHQFGWLASYFASKFVAKLCLQQQSRTYIDPCACVYICSVCSQYKYSESHSIAKCPGPECMPMRSLTFLHVMRCVWLGSHVVTGVTPLWLESRLRDWSRTSVTHLHLELHLCVWVANPRQPSCKYTARTLGGHAHQNSIYRRPSGPHFLSLYHVLLYLYASNIYHLQETIDIVTITTTNGSSQYLLEPPAVLWYWLLPMVCSHSLVVVVVTMSIVSYRW